MPITYLTSLLEKAHLRSTLLLGMMLTSGTIGCGWIVQFQVVGAYKSATTEAPVIELKITQYIEAPLVRQALIGFPSTGLSVVS